jgi:hypothetical protein
MGVKCTLFKKEDQLYVLREGCTANAVTISWLRPSSGIGKEISLHTEYGETIVIYNLNELDNESRRIAEEELEKKYIVAKIQKISSTEVHLGNRYFFVETDKGQCRFLVKNPFVNIRNGKDDSVWIRDVMGNLYCIESVRRMDKRSVRELEKVR